MRTHASCSNPLPWARRTCMQCSGSGSSSAAEAWSKCLQMKHKHNTSGDKTLFLHDRYAWNNYHSMPRRMFSQTINIYAPSRHLSGKSMLLMHTGTSESSGQDSLFGGQHWRYIISSNESGYASRISQMEDIFGDGMERGSIRQPFRSAKSIIIAASWWVSHTTPDPKIWWADRKTNNNDTTDDDGWFRIYTTEPHLWQHFTEVSSLPACCRDSMSESLA